MKPIQIISQDLFDKIRSRFQNLELGDKTGAITLDPTEAKFFDFDFIREGVNLGRISISINDPGSLKVFYSQGITENKDEVAKRIWFDFLKEMRYFAMRRLLRFDTRDVSKKNLDKNDFQFLAKKQSPKEDNMTSMYESRWNGRSSSKTSRRVQGRTQVIVRHKNKVNEMLPADRSKPSNITAIFIQNSDGERFKLPFNFLPLAFALAQHIDHGGFPYDPAGKKIIGMCEEYAKLSEFRKHIKTSTLNDDALQIGERAVGQLQHLKAQLESLGKRTHYESWIAEFNEDEEGDPLAVLDDVTLEQYKSKFTETNFKEELVQYFPIIHKLMQEKIDLEKYVEDSKIQETETAEEVVKENEFSKFEAWAEAVETGELRIDDLKTDMEEMGYLSGTPLDLEDGYSFFQGYGIDDPDLEEKMDAAREFPEEFNNDAVEVFKYWAIENDKTDLLDQLGIEYENPEAAPEEPEVAPEPQTPTAQAPAQPLAPAQPQAPVAETNRNIKHTFEKTINEIVSQHFNLDNENAHPFISDEKIIIEVGKSIKEKLEELGINDETKLAQAQAYAENLARSKMEDCIKMWENKHKKSVEDFNPQVSEDPLARLKELAGNLRQKFDKKLTDSSVAEPMQPADEPEMETILKLSGLKN